MNHINGGMEMFKFDGSTIILSALNVLVLYVILNKILFKPVTEFMEKRANSIKEMFETARASKEQAESMKAELKQQLDKAIEEAERIINEAKVKAEKQYEEIIDKAKAEAKLIIDRALKDIEVERKNMLNELKTQIAGIALLAASKVVQKNLDNEINRKLVNQFIDEVGAA